MSVCIDNLKSHDAKVGVVWPALVRRMLRERNAEGALHALMTAPMSSGHHYLFGDEHRVYGVETSGERKEVVLDRRVDSGDFDYVHTNHCLDASIAEVSWVSEWSTSYQRYAWLQASVEDATIESARDLWTRLGTHDGYPRSVCTHLASEENPHAMKTCGAVVMRPRQRELWAHKGCVHEVEPTVYRLGEAS